MAIYFASQKIKTIYFGNTKIKKGYLGDVQVYSSGEIIPKTDITPLSSVAYSPRSVGLDDYILNGGGQTTTAGVAVMDSYNENFVKTRAADMSNSRAYFAATRVGHYALFAGGRQNGGSGPLYDTVDAYNENLTKTICSPLINATMYFAGASVNNIYAIFTGGSNSSGDALSSVTIYDSNLTKNTTYNLSSNRYYILGCSVKDYALFGGGTNSSYVPSANVDTFNKNLTKGLAPSLIKASSQMLASHSEDFAVFCRQQTDKLCEIYDKNLTSRGEFSFPTSGYARSDGRAVDGTIYLDYLNLTKGNSVRLMCITKDLEFKQLDDVLDDRCQVNCGVASFQKNVFFCGGQINMYTDIVRAFQIT